MSNEEPFVYDHAKMMKARAVAVSASYKFAEAYKDAIPHFTILKAFELGYMQAIIDGEDDGHLETI